MKMNEKNNGVKTMDVILIIVGLFLAAFTATMIALHITTGSTPDTLITCVFAACAGECGIMGWIKNTKERQRDRKYELEDREYAKKERSERDE